MARLRRKPEAPDARPALTLLPPPSPRSEQRAALAEVVAKRRELRERLAAVAAARPRCEEAVRAAEEAAGQAREAAAASVRALALGEPGAPPEEARRASREAEDVLDVARAAVAELGRELESLSEEVEAVSRDHARAIVAAVRADGAVVELQARWDRAMREASEVAAIVSFLREKKCLPPSFRTEAPPIDASRSVAACAAQLFVLAEDADAPLTFVPEIFVEPKEE
jgi:hypothetical protein